MSQIERFAVVLAMDCLLAFMYYLWQIEGMEQAGSVFMFMIWFCGVGGILVMVAGSPKAKDHKPRLLIHRWLSCVATLSFLVGTIWAGHIVAACFYALSWVVMRGYGDRAKEAWEAAQCQS